MGSAFDYSVGDVDADDALGRLREVRAAVADAAGGVEHVAPFAPRAREVIALEVDRDDARLGLVRDDALGIRHGGKYR